MRGWLVVALMAAQVSAHASPCPATASWHVQDGTLSPGVTCGDVVLATPASLGDRATARLMVGTDDGVDADLDVTWQVLGATDATLEVYAGGAYVLVETGRIGLYVTEAQWSASGYTPVANLSLTRPSTLHLALRGTSLSASIDGTPVATWALPVRPPSSIVLSVVGPRARRTRALLSSIVWTGRAP